MPRASLFVALAMALFVPRDATANEEAVMSLITGKDMPDERLALRLVEVEEALIRARVYFGPRHPHMLDLRRRQKTLLAAAMHASSGSAVAARARLAESVAQRILQLQTDLQQLRSAGIGVKHPSVREVIAAQTFYHKVLASTGASTTASIGNDERVLRALVDGARGRGQLLSFENEYGDKHPLRVAAEHLVAESDAVLASGVLTLSVCARLGDAFREALSSVGNSRASDFEGDTLLLRWLEAEATCRGSSGR